MIDRALAAQWPEGGDRTPLPLALAAKRAAQLGACLDRPSAAGCWPTWRAGVHGHEIGRSSSRSVEQVVG